MAHLTIPTDFTANDKMGPVMDKMAGKVAGFSGKLETALDKSSHALGKFTPHLDHIAHSILESFGIMAVVQKLEQGIEFSIEAVEKYDESLQDLRAQTGLNGEAFEEYKGKILEVAKHTQKSAIDVAQAFTVVGKERPELLKNAEALSEVSGAAIELAKAGKMELEPAAKSLMGVMNKFGLGPEDAEHAIDAMAAGAKAGSSKIGETNEALMKFGSTAKQVGMSLNESIALTEMVSGFSKGEEAGTKLQKILNIMQTPALLSPKALAGMQKYHVNLKLMSDKTVPFAERLKEFTKIGNSTTIMTEIFGKKSAELGFGLMKAAGSYEEILAKTKEHGAAEKMAAENENTLEEALARVKNAWINVLVGTNAADGGLNKIKGAIDWVAIHMEDIVKWGGRILIGLAAWKAWNIVLSASIVASNAVATAFYVVDMIKYVASTNGMSFAQAAWAVTTETVKDAQLALNMAMEANPIGIVIAAVTALALAIYNLSEKYNQLMDDIHANQEKGFKSELSSVDKLAAKYEKLGMTKEEALKKAIDTEKEDVIKQHEDIKQRADKTSFWDTDKRKALGEELAANNARMAALNDPAFLQKFHGEDEKIKNKVTSVEAPAPGSSPEFVSTKAEQQSATEHTINNKENGEMKILVEGTGKVEGVEQEKGMKHFKATLTSTQP